MSTLELWQWLASSAARELIEQVAAQPPRSVADFQRLRKDWSAEQVSLAAELVEARRKLEGKIPGSGHWWVDGVGVEQATRLDVARHKARRFRHGGVIVDACCGIGGDALALSEVGEVLAVDNDPIRTWMVRENTGCSAVCSKVEDVQAESWIHCDPARRQGQRRLWQLDDLLPPISQLCAVLERARGGAVKLGPGSDPRELDTLPLSFELEFVSYAGELTQLILWSGELREHARTATWIDTEGNAQSYHGEPRNDPPLWEEQEHPVLYLPDPALERSGLLASYVSEKTELAELAYGLGVYCAASMCEVPGFRSYEVIAEGPWRKPKVKRWLKEHDGGHLQVKTRGKALAAGGEDANQLQRQLSGRGATPYVLFVLRLGREVKGFICAP